MEKISHLVFPYNLVERENGKKWQKLWASQGGLNFFKVYFLLVTLLFIIFLVNFYFINSFLLNIVILPPADTSSCLKNLWPVFRSHLPHHFPAWTAFRSILWLLYPLQNTFGSIIFLRILRGAGTYQVRRPRGTRDLQDRFRVQIFSCLQGKVKQKSLMLLHKAFGFYFVFLFRLIRQTFIYFVIFGLNGVGREHPALIPTLCKLTLLD